ncbi:hypothetical protein P170DRAFT_471274 [Aspergillus steynii IBT 23096]|uniref:Grh/CP2 DB domain-containing protein n=1 Tax=Aspergillus steynii IBT 23096 TaxID=1392250 RepID=A0A2I2GSM2_9EURO|nr:uncharacterized protein P170DRAFT_471274 [Aspergillus steynii IBT 23096]PLB55877.1 hypothetical protein P170DRAFT_471274 [Aspergillus steynii IBT 23096]
MFHRRNAHKPSDAFLRDFQRKFFPVTTIPYTQGVGIAPDQLVLWHPGAVDTLPAFPPRSTSSPPPLSRQNCSCSVFNSRMCAVLHGSSAEDASPQTSFQHSGLQSQGNTSETYCPSAKYRRQFPNSHLDQPNAIDELHTPDHSQQTPRFRVTLHARTATYNPASQTPVTYLNRRQTYKISVVDTTPPVGIPHPVRYRTHFRIAFDNKDQRADPVAAWRLWRDHRGLNEASTCDGQLRAVEFVDMMSNAIRGRRAESSVVLESSSLDGFGVVWIADPQSGQAACEAHILFNFLSTDFTLSKGVQGAPLRLYAKTELLSSDAWAHPVPLTAEITYCRVKLFRDHGSERKSSNDAVHLHKALGQVQQKLDDLESGIAPRGMNCPRKRKRGKLPSAARRHFEPPYLVTTSDFSVSDELQRVKSGLETVLSSSLPQSVLWLQSDERDDPDQFPIEFSNSAQDPFHTRQGPAIVHGYPPYEAVAARA